MDNKKKLIIIAGGALLLLIIIVILALMMRRRSTPAGQTQQATQSSSPADQSGGGNEPVELLYSGLWESSDTMDALISKYEAEHPNITIKYTQQEFAQYEDKMYQRILENAPLTPDIIRFHNTWLPKFQSVLTPMPGDIYSTEEFSNTFYPVHVASLTGDDGYIYGIPLEVDGLVLFYNVDIFDEAGIDKPGTDWDTVRAQAVELTKTDENDEIQVAGLGIGSADNVRHAPEILELLMIQSTNDNTGFYDPTSHEISFEDQNGRVADALASYLSFVRNDHVWSPDIRSDLEFFYSGRLAMFIGQSWEAIDIIKANPALNFKAVPTPTLGTNQMYLGSFWAEGVSKTSQHPREAWEFLKWLSEPEQQKLLYSTESGVRTFGEPYSRRDLSSELESAPYVGAVMQEAPYFSYFPAGELYVTTDSLRDAIRNASSGDDPDTALQSAAQDINDYLEEVLPSK